MKNFKIGIHEFLSGKLKAERRPPGRSHPGWPGEKKLRALSMNGFFSDNRSRQKFLHLDRV